MGSVVPNNGFVKAMIKNKISMHIGISYILILCTSTAPIRNNISSDVGIHPYKNIKNNIKKFTI